MTEQEIKLCLLALKYAVETKSVGECLDEISKIFNKDIFELMVIFEEYDSDYVEFINNNE